MTLSCAVLRRTENIKQWRKEQNTPELIFDVKKERLVMRRRSQDRGIAINEGISSSRSSSSGESSSVDVSEASHDSSSNVSDQGEEQENEDGGHLVPTIGADHRPFFVQRRSVPDDLKVHKQVSSARQGFDLRPHFSQSSPGFFFDAKDKPLSPSASHSKSFRAHHPKMNLEKRFYSPRNMSHMDLMVKCMCQMSLAAVAVSRILPRATAVVLDLLGITLIS